MKRREFITLLGGAVAAWPLTIRPPFAERANAPTARSAKALGLTIPITLLARADEVIE